MKIRSSDRHPDAHPRTRVVSTRRIAGSKGPRILDAYRNAASGTRRYSPGMSAPLPLSAAIGRGEADPEVLTDIAVKYSVEVIGPVPEGYL